MRNQAVEPKIELRLILYISNNLSLKRKYTNEVRIFTLQRSILNNDNTNNHLFYG